VGAIRLGGKQQAFAWSVPPSRATILCQMGTLYIVATPIGNLSDLSPRGVETLKSVSKIYAEDTRRSLKLLSHFQIQKTLESYFEANEQVKIPQILSELNSGDIALVSDAGTPTISDPGFKLVRSAVQLGHQVISVPGPNAAILALTVSGLPTDRFTFLGFLPKGERARRILEEVKDWRTSLILYESPYRVTETLKLSQEVLGNRSASVSREMTKAHEETQRGQLSELVKVYGKNPVMGEVTIVIGSKEVA
jgi:16S rRNA (cytidine1402-2'-O)-methyltransferase